MLDTTVLGMHLRLGPLPGSGTLAGASLTLTGASLGRPALSVAVFGRDISPARLDARRPALERRELRLSGQARWNRRLWRRLAPTPEAVAGRPVAGPLAPSVSNRPEPPGAA